MRYELKILEGEPEIKVRKYNTHIPKDHLIYGIWDNDDKCFSIGDSMSPSYYFWTCCKTTATVFVNQLNKQSEMVD